MPGGGGLCLPLGRRAGPVQVSGRPRLDGRSGHTAAQHSVGGAALEAADIVLPVPLSTERLRARGFNQSALLAQRLSVSKTHSRTLLRLHATEAQSTLPRAQRLRNLRGAFAVEPLHAAALHGQRVVLVDDVMTTGATLEAAALPLRQAGVAHITAIVLARTGLD